MKALVVGGTGPTGPFIVRGLLERAYEVAILHRGTHEVEELPPEVEHIHTDPNFRENLDEALAGRTFDLCIASYGRLRHVAAALVDKTPRFIALGGSAYRGILASSFNFPAGEVVPIAESRPLARSEQENKLAFLVAAAERKVFELHPTGTYFRIPPFPYGPHQVRPREWLIVRRLLDRRPYIVLPDGGLTLYAHGYAENLAHGVLLAVDNLAISAGQSYNCADEEQLTLRQIVEVIAHFMNRTIEVKAVPLEIANIAHPWILQNSTGHSVLDLHKIKSELGYKDVVPSVDALGRTVRWLLDHPIESGSHMDAILDDPFNYEEEDRFLALYEKSLASMRDFSHRKITKVHPYAHPKERNSDDAYGR